MQVAKFLDPFCRRTDVEVIVPRLPNAPRFVLFRVLLKPALFRQQADGWPALSMRLLTSGAPPFSPAFGERVGALRPQES